MKNKKIDPKLINDRMSRATIAIAKSKCEFCGKSLLIAPMYLLVAQKSVDDRICCDLCASGKMRTANPIAICVVDMQRKGS